MSTISTYLPDVIIGAALLIGLILGAKRGFIKAVTKIVVLVLALVGAVIIANVFTQTVTEWVEPTVEQRVLEKHGSTAENPNPVMAVDQLLEKCHIKSESAKKFAHKLVVRVLEHENNVTKAVVSSVVGTVVHAALFLLSFLLLNIVLYLILNWLNLAAKLPVIHQANGLLGGLMGLAEAMLLVHIAVWACRRFGWFITEDMMENSHLLPFFANINPMELVMSFVGK